VDFIPQKSQDGDWVELRKLGKWGEIWIEGFLQNKGVQLLPLNLYSTSDESTDPMKWEDLKKYPKIPDFIARDNDGLFLFDVKTKRKYGASSYYFWVNKRDYEHYLKFTQIIQVKIYFVFVNHKPVEKLTGRDVKGVFLHVVTDRKYPENYNPNDKNVVIDVKDYKQQIR